MIRLPVSSIVNAYVSSLVTSYAVLPTFLGYVGQLIIDTLWLQ